MSIDQTKRARRAWAILAKRATRGARPLTYKQLCRQMQLHWRAARWFLGIIQQYCGDHHLQPLQALVVNARTGVPGAGYIATARRRTAHRKTVGRVHAQSWSPKAPF